MIARTPAVIEPEPHLSSAFRILPHHLDRLDVAENLIQRNLLRVLRLPECMRIEREILSNPLRSAELESEAEADETPISLNERFAQKVITATLGEIDERNMSRVHVAVRQDSPILPTELERQSAVALYDARHDATWPELARKMAAYTATRWLLDSTEFPRDSHEPITIRQALIEMAMDASAVPHVELRGAYMRWGQLILAGLPPQA